MERTGLYFPPVLREAPPLPTASTGRPHPGRALLVAPFYPKEPRASFGKHVLTPALTLTSLAAATPPGWTVTLWDENLLQGPPPADPLPQVVGITVHLTFARRAHALADWYRARGCVVVLGGLHVQACPEEARPHADALSLGNGVRTWPRILADVAAGHLQPVYDAPFDGFAEEPLPDRSLLPAWGFLTPLSLTATRGCHNRCGFCYLSTRGVRMRYETVPVERIVEQFRTSGAAYGVFVDNNLGSDRAYLAALCDALEPLGVIWSAAVSLDLSDDAALVHRMARAGCTGVFIGFESLSEANLAAAGKRVPPVALWSERVARFHRVGIQVNGSFVLGFDGDGPDVFRRTLAWVEQNRLECATYHILTPYPGTPLFQKMEDEGRILHRDWDRYDTAHCVFRPARMSPEELEAGWAWLYEETFSARSVWARRPTDPGALPAYLGMAALYKKSNRLWPTLIRNRLVHAAWAPLVELSRQRHLAFRRTLPARPADERVPEPTPHRGALARALQGSPVGRWIVREPRPSSGSRRRWTPPAADPEPPCPPPPSSSPQPSPPSPKP